VGVDINRAFAFGDNPLGNDAPLAGDDRNTRHRNRDRNERVTVP
jgi:hypothetical protein